MIFLLKADPSFLEKNLLLILPFLSNIGSNGTVRNH
jgi:hypothetical protein